eukprot:1153218-Pelagomonas_calceolata.AAC.1
MQLVQGLAWLHAEAGERMFTHFLERRRFVVCECVWSYLEVVLKGRVDLAQHGATTLYCCTSCAFLSGIETQPYLLQEKGKTRGKEKKRRKRRKRLVMTGVCRD